MMIRASVLVGLCASLLGTVFVVGRTVNSQSTADITQKRPERFRSPFRYAIVGNDIVNPTGHPEDAFRYVVILLDEKRFSENTLKSLFKLVSARFPTPRRLEVQVYTSLEQVETPEEHEQGKVSESPSDPNMDKYHWALFTRALDYELFRYNAKPPDPAMKTVVLKGKDPTARLD